MPKKHQKSRVPLKLQSQVANLKPHEYKAFEVGVEVFIHDFNDFILSISTWSVYWLDVHLIQYAFGFGMAPSHSLLLLIVSSLFMSIPSAPGMIGTFHAGVKYVMLDLFATSYVYTVGEATSFAIVLHAYGYISYTLFGAIYFAKSQFHKNAISEVLQK